ncbi:hypothetical protein BU24DRAFT_408658 [Aaosphaeria arxii CBS 175.79]|uniref:COP9 signalosome complex subunit 6 n=1 Tax=Aaosphaeria arxii CBS 175.79 TaxID=1450172 RepID=A0A6A5XT70_9PLEO|nr:uncharacterized protein BU24DRAFT_408658 [Aaosphaeria arxii CBS 175.79]KAF2015444.1 hypothetical protein BU24DRAFT_408658 [Aaosphaeria arxii CBS 175.79]
MADQSTNPLISTARASDTSPTIQLHPLVLLTISDCITRHTLRKLPGPVVGAIIGQQNGQDITMEVAFQAKLQTNAEGDIEVDDEWFKKRLDEFKIVHKQPQLDLVGWFTLGPSSGPQPYLLPIHNYISQINEAPILVLFHAEDASSEATAAGKLPLTLYESVFESAAGGPNDKAMDIDGAVQAKAVKFRELVYSIETGEAEMIGVDFVARGGGNATAVEGGSDGATKAETKAAEEDKSKKGKGKQKEKLKEEAIDEANVLTAEDEEVLSTLTAKMNAIRMLSRRISLLRAYLASLPPSYLSDPSKPFNPTPDAEHPLPLNHTILRSISATLSRINILSPPDTEAFTLESQQEASDVQLVALLSAITNSTSSARELGKKSYIVEHTKSQNRRASGWPGGDGSYLDPMIGGGPGGALGLGGGRQMGGGGYDRL